MPTFENITDLATALDGWLRTCTDEERAQFHAAQKEARDKAMTGPDARFFFYEEDARSSKRPKRRR